MRRLVLILLVVLLAGVGSASVASARPRVKPQPAPPPPPVVVVDGPDCGAQVTKADGTPWQCTFVDDFDGSTLDRSVWLPQTGMATGTATARACEVDDPDTVAVAGGSLRLTVRPLDEPIDCAGTPADYASGQVSTYHTFSQQYGRFEARMKVADTDQPGLQETFWLWPDDRVASSSMWPAAGEIDVAETYSQYPTLNIPFLHYTWYDNWGPRPGLNTAWNCAAQRGVFNTYDLTWTPTTLTIAVNGRTCLVNTSGDAAFQKPYILAFTAALGVGANGYTGTAPQPATTEVDYVKAWK